MYGDLSAGSGLNALMRDQEHARDFIQRHQDRLLYGSDPFQKQSDGAYRTLQAVTELQDAVTRQRLSPERFIMMHVDVTPWSDLLQATASSKAAFPGGKSR